MSNKPVIFISNFHPFITRNILMSGVLDILKERAGKVVIFVAEGKVENMKSLFEKDNVYVEGVAVTPYIESARETHLRRIADLLLDTLSKKHHKLVQLRTDRKWFHYILRHVFTKIFGNIYFAKKLFRYIDYTYNYSPLFDRYYDIYKPDIVFTTEIFGEADVVFLKSAKRHQVKNVGMVRSWDNPTTKTLMRVVPDTLIVQNEIEKDECATYHHVRREQCVVSGIPQYEYLATYTAIPREEFCKKIGVDPKKRIILFSPAGKKFIDNDWQICEILKQLKAEKMIPEDVVFLVRLHPENFTDLTKFTPTEDFIIEDPGLKFGESRKDAELSRDGVHHLADSLIYTEMTINVLSSILLDAIVFDKPVITVGFDGWDMNVEYIRRASRNHAEACFKKMFSVGATPIVKNKEELAKWINTYLEDPKVNSQERQELIREQLMSLDGKAKYRIADAVLPVYNS